MSQKTENRPLSSADYTADNTYSTSGWGDLPTSYDSDPVEYDAIGNPTNDLYWQYTWEHGRQLARMADVDAGGPQWDFTYNADGMRTQRTNGTTTYNYVYNGSSLSQMTVGNDTLTFAYDANGMPVSVTHNNGATTATYYYATNLQGDVTGIFKANGDFVVIYLYDAWGNVTSVTGSMENTLGTLNPLRYRGYVYDQETVLYYLQSRYYNPEIGRFINADALPSTGQGLLGNNMFAYCGNNPVTRIEIGGYFWDTVFDVISLGFSIAEVIKNPDDPMAWLGVAADVASLVIPCVAAGGAIVRAATKADDVVDAVKAIDNVDNFVDTTKAIENTQAAVKIHGNSLSTTKETVGYALRKNDTHEIMKFGETTRGTKRYTKKFYAENNVYMDIMERGSKYDMHYWQHEKILGYTRRNGHRPPWNKSNW